MTDPSPDESVPRWLLGRWRLLRAEASLDFAPGVRMDFRPGGRLLYATCSLFKTEGQERIDAFLQRHGAGHVTLDPASPGHLLPLPDNAEGVPPGHARAVHDGFFYALIHQP